MKKFYWLKLKEDYFNSPKIKKLRKIAGGDTYTIIYLKMQLLSISNDGVIKYEGIEPTFQEELALKLDEDVENVNATLIYIQSQGLIEESDNKFLLVEASNSIGSETDGAERIRRFRIKQKEMEALRCNASVTQVKQISISNSISNSNSESISKEKEEEKEIKHKYGEYNHVLLTDRQYNKLVEDYGESKTLEAIKYLDEYTQMKGYKCKDHNLAMRKWVFDAISKNKKDKTMDILNELYIEAGKETEKEEGDFIWNYQSKM